MTELDEFERLKKAQLRKRKQSFTITRKAVSAMLDVAAMDGIAKIRAIDQAIWDKAEAAEIEEGSSKSGWYGPPKGTHTGDNTNVSVKSQKSQLGASFVDGGGAYVMGRGVENRMGKQKAKEFLQQRRFFDEDSNSLMIKTFNEKRGKNEIEYGNDKQIDTVATLLGRHPESALKGLTSITVCSSLQAWQFECRKYDLDPKKTLGFYDKYRKNYKNITLKPNFEFSTFDHEMGHSVWNQTSTRGSWLKEYRTNTNFDRHTWYSKTDKEEGFCESYMAWMGCEGKAVHDTYKNTFNKVEKVVTGTG